MDEQYRYQCGRLGASGVSESAGEEPRVDSPQTWQTASFQLLWESIHWNTTVLSIAPHRSRPRYFGEFSVKTAETLDGEKPPGTQKPGGARTVVQAYCGVDRGRDVGPEA